MKRGIGLFLLLPLVAAAGAAPAEETAGGVAVRETCEGRPKGSACWMGLADRPECYLWNPNLQPGDSATATATWTGECSGGLAQGTGTIIWRAARNPMFILLSDLVLDGETVEYTGRLENGKKHGRWVERYADGRVVEGPYVKGKRHGRWVFHFETGDVQEGPYVDGKRHGNWVIRFAGMGVQEGPNVDGKRQGRWVWRDADGTVVEEGTYANDRKHGRWVERYANGRVEEGPYVDGRRQGRWVVRFADGTVWEGRYWDGKKGGNWVIRNPDGQESHVDGSRLRR